jgi:glucan biosynthesis protein C
MTERIHYLDNLRALAMLLGVFLHGALAYANPTQIVWLVTDPQSSVLLDATFNFIHLFRMALFFLIS